MIQDIVTEDGDVKINPDTGDFDLFDDSDHAESTRIALGVNRGELSWNPSFGLDHLALMADLDDEVAVESELNEYLETQFDNFVSLDVESIKRTDGRTAIIHTRVTYLDDDGTEQTNDAETEVENDGVI